MDGIIGRALWMCEGGRPPGTSLCYSREHSPFIMGVPAVLANMAWRTAGSSATRGIPGGDTSI